MTDPAPHCDAGRFDECVASVEPASLLVVIEREMGPAARSFCAPEDVLQETLAQAWRDREQHTWEGPRAYRAWLLAIARNRIRDIARTASRDKRGGGTSPVPFSGLAPASGGSLSDLLPAGSVTPSRVASAQEEARLLRDALESLPETLRDVVRMHHFEGLTVQAIAERLSVEHLVARHRFRKGLALFSEKLEFLRSRSAAPGTP
jgi:RNA polymerase sigma factor (sigma-70 family)